jgi:hypothetical protein
MVHLGCPAQVCPATLVGIDRVVGEYNANAVAIPRLWARAKIDLQLVGDKGQIVSWGSILGAGNGLLLFGKNAQNPAEPDFVLVGRESGRELFRLGASSGEGLYYVWYQLGQDGGAWAGHVDRAGAPGAEKFFVDPLGLLSVLGVLELPTARDRLPAVALSMSRNPCAYVLTCIDRQPVTGQAVFKREIHINWSERDPRRPFQVVFFAPDGRRIMTARLANYQPVLGTKVRGRAAEIPTDITMVEEDWPGRKSHLRRLHLVLGEMSVVHKSPSGTDFDPVAAATFFDNLPEPLKDHVNFVDEPSPATQESPAGLPASPAAQEDHR